MSEVVKARWFVAVSVAALVTAIGWSVFKLDGPALPDPVKTPEQVPVREKPSDCMRFLLAAGVQYSLFSLEHPEEIARLEATAAALAKMAPVPVLLPVVLLAYWVRYAWDC